MNLFHTGNNNSIVEGVVCKKNVSNWRLTSNIEKPRFLILGGAFEYQWVSNRLSSFDTLLQQETDHLKMAVAKIVAHHPNVLLVEISFTTWERWAGRKEIGEDTVSFATHYSSPFLIYRNIVCAL
ncbi:hypothetical protein MKX03_013282 [Papaver bracteatum]|nr:hypothetical protein MKX03_013282 [Papaver bracteatum]